MASTSSSAVLALNDADEDTEAPSVSEDVEGAPLIMEHGYDIAVKVDAPMKQLSTLETFVTYRVRCVCARWPPTAPVRRRYNHFKALHKRLVAAYPLLAIPPLPPLHTAREQLDRYSPSFVAVRTMHTHAHLDRIAKHPILTHSEDFRIFLTTPDDQFEKVFKSESSALNLWGFSLYSTHGAEPKPDGVRVKDPEFSAVADYLQSIQVKLTTLCSLTTKLCKGTVALGNEWEHMKRTASSWSSQAGGLIARACAALSGGARAAAGARRSRHPHGAAKATLPFLGAYAGAVHDKIRHRDALHVAHVAGNNSDDLHNRLEQASEALRADLADWAPKTRHDVKGLLLELADRQVNIHSQSLTGWEHALRLASVTNVETLFKTVSKTAVQNLSPSKCRTEPTSETEREIDELDDLSPSKCRTEITPTETERDFDELGNYSNASEDLKHDAADDISNLERNGEKKTNEGGKLEQNGRSETNEAGDEFNFKRENNLEHNFAENNTKEISEDKMESLDSESKSKSSDKPKVMSDPLHDFSEIDLSL